MRFVSSLAAGCMALLLPSGVSAQAAFTVSGTCPASISAERFGSGEMQSVGAQPSREALGQGLRISIDAQDKQKVLAADVTVRAYSARGRYIPAGPDASPDIARSFHLVSAAPAPSLFRSQVWLPGTSAIAWLDVKAIRFADGTTWNAPKGSACRIYPPGYLPVTGRH